MRRGPLSTSRPARRHGPLASLMQKLSGVLVHPPGWQSRGSGCACRLLSTGVSPLNPAPLPGRAISMLMRALYLFIIIGLLWSPACQVQADPINNFTCVPDETPRDPNDLLAAYNVFRGRYITPAPGSTAIHKAHVIDRCMFILWTRYRGSVPGNGPGVDHAYVLTKDVGFDCAFTLTELGPDFAPIGTVGRIDFAKLRFEYKVSGIGVRAIGNGQAVCDGERVEVGILTPQPNRCYSTFTAVPNFPGEQKFFDSLAHIYARLCQPLPPPKPDLR